MGIGLLTAALLAGALVRVAWADEVEERLVAAEVAYAQGRLAEAEALAGALGAEATDDALVRALRLRVEIALREQDVALAGALVRELSALPELRPSERAWLSRAELRLACDHAERAGDLPVAEALWVQVQATGALRPAEEVWVAWARVRLDLRAVEFYGTPAQLREAAAAQRPEPGSPEERWLAAALARAAVVEAEAACDWALATERLVWVSSPQTRAWAEAAALRVQVRGAVREGRVQDARVHLEELLGLPGLSARDRAWAQGYAAWLAQERLRRQGEPVPAALSGAVQAWRVEFPGEGGCEAAGLDRRGVDWGEQPERPQPERPQAERPPRREGEVSAPGGAVAEQPWAGELWVGAGALGWVDGSARAARVPEPGSAKQAGAAAVLGLDGGWGAQPGGRLLVQGHAGGQLGVLLDRGAYASVDLNAALRVGTPRGSVGPLVGVRTLSVPLEHPEGEEAPTEWCHSREAVLPVCPVVGAQGTDYWRGLLPVGYIGASVWLAPVDALTLELRLAGSPSGAPDVSDYPGRDRLWTTALVSDWSSPVPWLGVRVQASAAGLAQERADGPEAERFVEWGAALGVRVEGG